MNATAPIARRPRPPGTGTIDELPSGRFRPRLPRRLTRKPLGLFDTYEAAESILDAVLAQIADGELAPALPGAVKLGNLIGPYLAKRKADGFASLNISRWNYDAHVATHEIALIPVESISTHDVRSWRDHMQVKLVPKVRRKRPDDAPPLEPHELKLLSRRTIKNNLNSLRGLFDFAIEKRIITTNPAAGVKVTRRDRHITSKVWTYLTFAEQTAFLACDEIPEWVRVMAAFAWGCGLRKGELACLHLDDLVVDGPRPHVFVRYGSPGKLPKNGNQRTVPLFGVALAAAKRWLEMLPEFAAKNEQGLVFPTARGACRWGKRIKNWPAYVAAAGIKRRVRWHDLRHTCASSLVAGWWGRLWRLDEVRDLLGHSAVSVTEIYAHLAESAIDQAAQATPGAVVASGSLTHDRPTTHNAVIESERENKSALGTIRTCDHWFRRLANSANLPANIDGHGSAWVTPAEVLEAVASGSPDALTLAGALARQVLEGDAVRLAREVAVGGPHVLRRAVELAQHLAALEAAEAPAAVSS